MRRDRACIQKAQDVVTLFRKMALHIVRKEKKWKILLVCFRMSSYVTRLWPYVFIRIRFDSWYWCSVSAMIH